MKDCLAHSLGPCGPVVALLHVPGLHLGVQAKEAALLWDVPFLQPRKRQQTAPQTPAPVLLIPSLLTAQGHTSHISHLLSGVGWGGDRAWTTLL